MGTGFAPPMGENQKVSLRINSASSSLKKFRMAADFQCLRVTQELSPLPALHVPLLNLPGDGRIVPGSELY